jgi:hypothetical protein
MMAGTPPVPLDLRKVTGPPKKSDFWVRALPRRYSSKLREIVLGMLRTDPKARPTAEDLSVVVGAGFATWMEETEEGKRMILKGRSEYTNGIRISQIEEMVPNLVKQVGRLEDI